MNDADYPEHPESSDITSEAPEAAAVADAPLAAQPAATDDAASMSDDRSPVPEPSAFEEAPLDEEVSEGRARMDQQQLRAIVEALIFASPEPLTPKMLVKLLSDEPKEDVMAAVAAVQEDYASRPGLHVAEVAGGYQITTRPELHEWVRRLFHERTTQKLSVASLETLSVIAYKQPITQAEIAEIRGVNASGVLSTLLERHLVKIVGRKNVVGRPFLYGTTREFLIRFGLKDVTDLPRIEDMAQQLGFEPPSVLMERTIPEEMLPLEEDQAPAEDDKRAADEEAVATTALGSEAGQSGADTAPADDTADSSRTD